ncbi:MAG TPA: V-type ATP synthase subunit E [Rhabdochlamydiaceae bacterium]|nr:V-type ATP synthase subunit E [Rhabdochlamydiaceae bacterium]
MKGIETGKDKVKKICEVLKKETLEPAKKEAEDTIAAAQAEAEQILNEAHRKAENLLSEAKAEIEKRDHAFQSSINQAYKQTIESLKQQIEEKLINRELGHLIAQYTQDPKVLAQLVNAVVKALEKEGVDADLSAYIPAAVQAKAVNALLGEQVLSKLKEKSVLLGPMAGGIEVKLRKDNISIDITDAALKELLSNYMRKEFREMFFGS